MVILPTNHQLLSTQGATFAKTKRNGPLKTLTMAGFQGRLI